MRFLEKLEERERLFVLGFGILLFFLLIIGGGSLLYGLRQELGREAEDSADILQRLQYLKSRILSLEPAQDLPEKTQIFANVNNMLGLYQLKPTSINEKEKQKGNAFEISIRLQSVPMPSLLNFLYDVEYKSKLPLSVTSLRLRRTISKEELYDVNLAVSLNP